MEYALALLLFWSLLFLPLGLAVHWLVLGTSARRQALPIALLSGLASGLVLLAALDQAGIDIARAAIPLALLVVSVVLCVAFWRWGVAVRSRDLLSALLLVLLAMFLMHLPVFDAGGVGPLGYGTGYEPVTQTARIQQLVSDGGGTRSSGDNAAVRAARADQNDRFIGFERLAAMTVAAGDRKGISNGDATRVPINWTSYSLHALIAGMLCVLTMLPLFVLARWRGIGWLGILVLLLVGVLSPMAMTAMALAQAPAVAAVPFTTAAVLAMLIARRDRGWYAIAVLNAAAVLTIVGPAGLLPIALTGLAWLGFNRVTREHLAHTDTPVTTDRPIIFGALVTMLTLFGSASALLDAPALPWQRFSDSLGGALVMWPLAWVGGDLTAAIPNSPQEFVVWLLGPALLLIAIAYAVARKEGRELALLAGIAGSLLVGGLVWLSDHNDGASLIEYTWLVASPLLAMVAVRTVGLARAGGTDKDAGAFAGSGPVLIVAVLVLFSVSASGVSGSRMVHAPPLAVPDISGSLLIAAGDPWLAYVLDGERARGGHVDADLMADQRNVHSRESLVYGKYGAVILSSNPLGSDPPTRYRPSSLLDSYSARLFVDAKAAEAAEAAAGELQDGTKAAPSSKPVPAGAERPRRHDPVESEEAGANQLGGALIPATSLKRCNLVSTKPCATQDPIVSPSCRPADIERLRAVGTLADEQAAAAASARTESGEGSQEQSRASDARGLVALGTAEAMAQLERDNQTAEIERDADLALGQTGQEMVALLQPKDPQLLGVACFEVELDQQAKWLTVHLRDVGLILSSLDAIRGTSGAFTESLDTGEDEALAHNVLSTDELGAELAYGNDRVIGTFDVTLEGAFGAGVRIGLAPPPRGETEPPADSQYEIRGNFGGWSQTVPTRQVAGQLTVANTSGSEIRVGRLFLRPLEFPRSCDVHLRAKGDTWKPYQYLTAIGALPSVTVGISRIDGRKATVVVGNYMQRHGLPHYVLADWTEQYVSQPVNSCELQDTQAKADPASAFSDR